MRMLTIVLNSTVDYTEAEVTTALTGQGA